MELKRFAIIEVEAGTLLGKANAAYYRRWEVRAASAARACLLVADRLTEAYAYAGTLPLPKEVRWVNVHVLWL